MKQLVINGGKDEEEGRRDRIRLPGFISHEDVGLGDVLKSATSAFGVTPCGACKRRAEALNRWLVFSGRSSR
jgi:hypothetical protein